MHSEHLRNVQLSWAAFGWFVALAVASSFILLLAGLGILDRSIAAETVGVALAVAVGWGVGGFIIGYRTAAAPILHGGAMALFSFVAWFVLTLLAGGLTGSEAHLGYDLPARSAALALLVQAAAAITGCWLGYRYAPVRVE